MNRIAAVELLKDYQSTKVPKYLQTSGLVKKQKNQICSYNNNYVTKDKFRTFGASQALAASDPAPWRPQVYMKLTLTHSVTMMQLA